MGREILCSFIIPYEQLSQTEFAFLFVFTRYPFQKSSYFAIFHVIKLSVFFFFFFFFFFFHNVSVRGNKSFVKLVRLY